MSPEKWGFPPPALSAQSLDGLRGTEQGCRFARVSEEGRESLQPLERAGWELSGVRVGWQREEPQGLRNLVPFLLIGSLQPLYEDS